MTASFFYICYYELWSDKVLSYTDKNSEHVGEGCFTLYKIDLLNDLQRNFNADK